MYSKENIEIHIIVILEGTGHFQRGIHVYQFLKDEGFSVKFFVFYYYKKFTNYIKFFNYYESLLKKINSIEDFKKEQHKKYLLILDIRDHNPFYFQKYYGNQICGILCLANYYERSMNIDYHFTLPHPGLNMHIGEVLKNYLFPYSVLKSYYEFFSDSIPGKIFYWGDTSLLDFDISEIQAQIIKKYNLIQSEVQIIDYKNYMPLIEFYKIFLKSSFVIAYPGNVFYESLLLNKKLISFYTNSRMHNQILEKIMVDFQDQILEKFKISGIPFIFFDFSRNQFFPEPNNLWTSYFHIKNWIEKKFYEFKI